LKECHSAGYKPMLECEMSGVDENRLAPHH
jgi:hypothetical protein